MRAWVRTDQLTGLNLTTGDVIGAIQAQNVQAPVGRIGARPISDEQQLQLSIQTQGRLTSAEQFRNIVLRTNPDGSVLRLGDVARIELGAANLDRETRLNGSPATVIAIYQSPGANALSTLKEVERRVGELAKAFPEGLAWKVTYDPTAFITETVHEVQKTLLEAFVLVVIVVFLFLGSLRATLIPTLAVPVSLIGTFIVLKAVGYSANSVSLLALVLAIGIVVDDAIVVVENVERVMEEHPELSPGEATKQAMAEITAPIIAITLVLLSVFVPVAFMPGISGELFRQFAVDGRGLDVHLGHQRADPVAGPVRRAAAAASRPAPRHHGLRDALHRPGSRRLRCGRRPHRAPLDPRHRARRRRRPTARSSSRSITPTGFLPEDDQGAFFVVVQLPEGASVGRTSDVVARAEEILRQEHAVADTTSVIGLNFIDNYSQGNAGLLGRDPQALRGAQRGRGRGGGPDRAARPEVPRGAWRDRGPARAAADHRSRYRWRLQLRPAGPARRRPEGTRPGAARPGRGGKRGAEAQPRVQHLLGDEPLGLSSISTATRCRSSGCP